VPDFRGRAVDAAPQLAVENDAATNASAERDADDRAATLSRTLPHLADRRGVRIVFENRRQTELVRQRGRKREAVETRKIRCFNHRTVFDVNRARHNERDRFQSFSLVPEISSVFIHGVHDSGNDLMRIGSVRRVLLRAKMDLAVLVHGRGAQVRAAEIGCEDQILRVVIHDFR